MNVSDVMTPAKWAAFIIGILASLGFAWLIVWIKSRFGGTHSRSYEREGHDSVRTWSPFDPWTD